jgi:tellurite resistance protein TerC
MHPFVLWTGFHFILALLLLCDWRFFQRLGGKKAWVLSAFWIALALLFNGFVYLFYGPDSGLQFFTAYIVEKSLSVDNLLVFLFLLKTIPRVNQHKILFCGIWGAIVFRLLFILLGIQLLNALQWMTYVLGALLCFTAIRFMMRSGQNIPSFLERLFSFLPIAKKRDSSAFFLREEGHLKATSLFSLLLLVESADLLFAIDSVPAVLAVTKDSFIAYTSNVFAILGLRSLYFALYPHLEKMQTLRYGLAAILLFAGVKMLLAPLYTIPLFVSLLVIVGILLGNLLFIHGKKTQ